MRHRLRVSLYDEYRVDAELLDYLEQLPPSHRGDYLQRLLRVGHMILTGAATPGDALLKASLPELRDVVKEAGLSSPHPAAAPAQPPETFEGSAQSRLESQEAAVSAPPPQEAASKADSLESEPAAPNPPAESPAPANEPIPPAPQPAEPVAELPASNSMDALARMRSRALNKQSDGGLA